MMNTVPYRRLLATAMLMTFTALSGLVGCSDGNPIETVIVEQVACNDGRDNDGDGKVDFAGVNPAGTVADDGCASALDDDESVGNELADCRDGIDNDGDGFTDFPEDLQCLSLDDTSEFDPSDNTGADCRDGRDNDGDGLIDFPQDPGCSSINDISEFGPDDLQTDCSDGQDNDGDGLVDFPADPGCVSLEDPLEVDNSPACSDSIDNDGDNRIDFGDDPGCATAEDNDESNDTDGPTFGCVAGESVRFIRGTAPSIDAVAGTPAGLCIGCEALNPANVVDFTPTNAATLSTPITALGGGVGLTVRNNTPGFTYDGSKSAGFVIRDPANALLSLELLAGRVSLTALLGDTVVSTTGVGTPLSLDLLGTTLTGAQPGVVRFIPTGPFNRLRIDYDSSPLIGALTSVDVVDAFTCVTATPTP